jgi:NADPH-dependent 7-cyano-7-deazaguanine reductase QueF
MKKKEIQKQTQVELSSNELLFLAHSGQPYRGSIYIAFESVGESFDMLDFKRYLTSLRSCTMSAEDIAFEIYSQINTNIKTKNLGVVVELSARGGIMQRLSYGAAFEVHKKANIFQVG